jgi:hypothetical protein
LKSVIMQELKKLHGKLEKSHIEMRRRRTKTVSDKAFKDTVKEILTEWKTSVKPLLAQSRLLGKRQIEKVDVLLNRLYRTSSARIADTREVRSELSELHELLFRYELQISSRAKRSTAIYKSTREDLLMRLALSLKQFEVANDYFEEAKSCFEFGFMRAATIMAISALESCLKTDYLRIRGKQYDGKLSNLINRYFSGDLKRLPKQYEDFTKTYVKIRNSLTHPEEFDYSENIVFNVLSTVAELMKAVEKQY